MLISPKQHIRVRSLCAGFTIVEILVAILIGSIVATSVVSLFVHQTRAIALQEDLVALEQNLRIGMDMLSRDVRMAGLYTAKEIMPFDVGDIDCDGDGIHGDCRSEGIAGGPHAIAVLLSEDQGMEIIDRSSGVHTNIYFCSPEPFEDPLVDPTPLVFSDSSLFLDLAITNNKITPLPPAACSFTCPAGTECTNITFPSSLGLADTPGVGGHVWGDIVYVSYFIGQDYNCDGAIDGDTGLIRQSDGVCSVVAFGINGLDVTYLLDDGTETINEGSLNTVVKQSHIGSVRLVLAGETRNEHSISNEPDKKPKRRMTTEVRVRNLHL